MRSHRRTSGIAAAVLLFALAGCKDTTGPKNPPHYDVSKESGDLQLGLPEQVVGQPLQVVVSDAQSELPVEGVTVEWSLTQGTGATLDPPSSVTDSDGVATTEVTLGSATGTYRIQADVPSGVVTPVVFELTAVEGLPEITSITPQSVTAGDTVTIAGIHFGSTASQRSVRFDGVSGLIVSGTDSELRVVVPVCLPTRAVQVVVAVGTLDSSPADLDVTAGAAQSVALARGEVLSSSAPGELGCLRLRNYGVDTRYLIVLQNAATVAGASMPFRFTAVAGNGPLASVSPAAGALTPGVGAGDLVPPDGASLPAQIAWENRIRDKERGLSREQFLRSPQRDVTGAATLPEAVPSVGDTRDFQVINKDNEFTTVTGVVKYVGAHGVIYVDKKAPANGFSASDYQRFSDLYDDPIFDTDVATYGGPSDLDSNGHVIILFTPVVNELTPKGTATTTGFVAGFFYGNDLTNNSGSNKAEIFYSLVPDPSGTYGNTFSVQQLFNVVPPTLAHEFMHMIHFNERVLMRGGFGLDALWLSEGLAHSAEGVVGQVFADRGDTQEATNFEGANYTRAYYYLGSFSKSPDHTYDVSMISESGLGSLEQRGADWLMIKYLIGQNGIGILKELVQTTLTSTDNVATHAGRSWQSIFNDWSVALYADNDPELAGASVDPRYSFPGIDLRTTLYSSTYGGFALKPETHGFSDFAIQETLPASSPYFLIVDSGSSLNSLNLNFAPQGSGIFATNSRPQLAIMRLN